MSPARRTSVRNSNALLLEIYRDLDHFEIRETGLALIHSICSESGDSLMTSINHEFYAKTGRVLKLHLAGEESAIGDVRPVCGCSRRYGLQGSPGPSPICL